MKKITKHIVLLGFFAMFVSACNSSASSEAKKVEVKKVSTTTVASTESTSSATSTTNTTETQTDDTVKLAEFVEGQHYVRLNPPMNTDVTPGKIEVAELFWLGCPHCYSLEPEVLKYKANHPDYVEFKQIPAMLNPSWAADANTFYIAEILDPKNHKNLVTKLFQSIHDQKRRLRSPKAVNRFFVEQGYTEEQVEEVKKSMAFQAKLVRAQEFSAGSQADSVPTLIINGKYRTSPHMAGGNQQVMKVVSMLAEKENSN